MLGYFSYQEGYKIGIEEGKQSIEVYQYPIKVVAENVYTLPKNKTVKIVVEYYNPSDHKAFINRFYMRIPSEEWKVPPIPILINETEKEKSEVIEIISKAKIFDPGERRPIPFDIKTPNISGDYRIAFCIEYADGTEMCPRISWISVR
jgi:hypothetical protein